jgi:hypothetical protein
MHTDNSTKRVTDSAHSRLDIRAASDRVAILMIAERLFTVSEYSQLCADIGAGRVEIRKYEDGIVLTRVF